MRRGVALACAGLALVLAGAFAYLTWTCGVRSVSESCFSPEECDAKSVCVSALHPFAPVLVAVSLLGLALGWREQAFPLMLLGVLTSAVGTIFLFSGGLYGMGVGMMLALAGSALCGWPWMRVGAPMAALLSPALGVAAATFGTLGLFYVAVALPPVAWLALAGWEAQRRGRPTAGSPP